MVSLWWPTNEEIEGRSDLPKQVGKMIAPHTTIGLFRRIGRREIRTLGITMLPVMGLVLAVTLFQGNLWPVHTVYFVVMLGTIMLLHSTAVRRERMRIREAILGTGRCASCGYNLVDLPTSADGLTVCPECDAAWRLVARPIEE